LVFFGEVGDLDDGHFLTVASDNDFVCVVHAFVNSSAWLLCSHGTDCPVARS
jgi:hypothetical protein